MTPFGTSPRRPAAGRIGVVITAAALALTGCGGQSESDAGSSGVIDYWLWDTNQLPAYEKCAQLFEAGNPGQDVRISQTGWDDYWTKLTAGFIAGTGPDVFTNHVSKYPQFTDLEVLAPLDELPATSGVDPGDFQEGLADLWTGPDGHQYGMPKDWDTIGMFYNQDLLSEAGVSAADVANWTWNPDDGGSFEEIVAHLTVDKNGVRGDEPGFDKDNVAVYGFGVASAGGDNAGQAQWSGFAASNGWTSTNKALWGDHYEYDDPKLHETLDWFFSLTDKGYMPRYGQFNESEGANGQLASGAVAIVPDGAWTITSYANAEGINVGTARMPIGPDGTSKSMLNGLADSVVKDTDNPEGAAEWVAFLASAACQQEVARAGVVFPARRDSTPIAADVYRGMGIDPAPFIAPVEEDNTFYVSVTTHGADVTALVVPSLEDIWANRLPAATLKQTNDAINILFEADD